LQNPEFVDSIVDINININNPDFFHDDKPISTYYHLQVQSLNILNYNKSILSMESTSLEEYHDAITDPTMFDTILVKRVGYTQLYDLDLSESVG